MSLKNIALSFSLVCLFCISNANAAQQFNDVTPELLAQIGAPFAFGEVTPQNLDLGVVKEQNVTLVAAANFEGTLELGIERDELNKVDKNGDIEVVLDPVKVTLAKGETKAFKVKILVKTTAPSFAGQHFHLLAKDVTNRADGAVVEAEVPLQINAVYQIFLGGGASPEKWSSEQTTPFRTQAGGVLIRFVNLDKKSPHIIHGSGLVPHQDTDKPLAVATDAGPGGKYEFKVTSTTANASGIYYCHVHEGTGQFRKLVFNAQ